MTLDWTAFDQAARADVDARILDQFAADPNRRSRMSVEAAGRFLDLSKQSWTHPLFKTCLALALARSTGSKRSVHDCSAERRFPASIT